MGSWLNVRTNHSPAKSEWEYVDWKNWRVGVVPENRVRVDSEVVVLADACLAHSQSFMRRVDRARAKSKLHLQPRTT